MKINREKLDLALARQCKEITEFRGQLSPATLARIRRGDCVRVKTVGKLSKLLNLDPADIIQE